MKNGEIIAFDLSLPIGPSPWAFVDRSATHAGATYEFRGCATSDKDLAGLVFLQNSEGAILLIFNFYCYARILGDGSILVWREAGEKDSKQITFDCFNLSSLQMVADPVATAKALRENKLSIAPLPTSEHFEFSPRLDAGVHQLVIPHDWSRFGESLVLGDHGETNSYDKMSRAIFALDWCRRRVEVFPQDWFNHGSYDFGYQWITRVGRRTDGSIVGDGIRLGSFELDATNRKIKTWLTTDPFYRPQWA